MEIVTDKLSKNKTHNHLIFFMPEDPSTLASLILLNDYYKEIDIDVNIDKDWRYLFIAKRTFLRHQKKDNKWICHYCHKDILHMHERGKRMRRNQHKQYVTVDHKIPACKCLDKTDSSNFVVACHKCNSDKGTTPYEKFIHENKKFNISA